MTVETEQRMKIRRMAINAINLNETYAKVSETVFPLVEDNKIIEEFFITHFIETRSGKSTKSCKFIDEDATVKTKIKRYESNKTNEEFIKLSKELTENLFNIMKSSSSKSDGTFFVFDVELENEECVFLIKLDPKEGVQMDYENLTVQVLENILPDSNDRVHKCAIIRYSKPEGSKTDLFVMDKQQGAGEPARFFIESYLQAEELLNDRIITREVLRETESKLVDLLPEVSPSEIHSSIDQTFANGLRIELEKSIEDILIEVVPVDKEDRELFIENSVKQFVEGYVDKNPDHQTTFRVERNDKLIVFRAESDQVYFRYNKGIRTQVEIKNDESGNSIIKIDKNLKFQQDLK